MNKITVSELNNSITLAIKENITKQVVVVGEISNPKISGNNTWLTLKDANSSLNVVFFSQRIKQDIAQHGDNVEITGKIDFFKNTGKVTLIGTIITKVGIGSIHAQYEKIRDVYTKKGYFNNKKELPHKIKDIGIVTAEGGAALHDFIRVLRNNKFSGRVFVYNAIVQGARCADSVVAGIRFFDSPFYSTIDNNNIIKQTVAKTDTTTNNSDSDNHSDSSSDSSSEDPFATTQSVIKNKVTDKQIDIMLDKDIDIFLDSDLTLDMKDEYEQIYVDVVVITRGGGSFEDLMGFSDSKVLEAIYNSKHYTISSVGHEIDDMLSDFVANCSVGTPSMAGDAISKSCSKIHDRLNKIEKTIISQKQSLINKLHSIRQEVVLIENNLEDPVKKIINQIENVQKISRSKIWDSINGFLIKNKTICNRIAMYDYESLLKNGFSVLIDKSGQIVRNETTLFDQELKLIHETGEYMIKIVKI